MAPPTPPQVPEKPAPSRIVGRIIVTMTIVTAVVVGIITLGAGRRLVEQRRARVAPTNPVTPAPEAPAAR